MKKPGKIPPSIFNDVIGPVMRGPSSSHCAGALRIGRIARDVMGRVLDKVEKKEKHVKQIEARTKQ